MFFDATVNFVVGEEWYVLSPKETVCEVFDLAEAHDCFSIFFRKVDPDRVISPSE